MSSDNVQVRIDAGMIPDTCFVEGPSCRANRGVLLLDYLVQHADGSKVVLHLLERREDSLPIVGHSYIVGCQRLPHLRAARSFAEDGLREARPETRRRSASSGNPPPTCSGALHSRSTGVAREICGGTPMVPCRTFFDSSLFLRRVAAEDLLNNFVDLLVVFFRAGVRVDVSARHAAPHHRTGTRV